MRQFDTSVQELHNKVLTAVARLLWRDAPAADYLKVPEEIIPGPKAQMRCCIYKERAVVGERVKIALGGDQANPNMVETLSIACDECPVTQMSVSDACRGCIAHRCVNSCPRDAITVVGHKAHIDREKCILCGKCLTACPYSAIIKSLRPCEKACKVGALSMGADSKAVIDNDKCISCGACAYQCPFGAIVDKSFLADFIHLVKGSQGGEQYKVHAVVAPSISSQFLPATVGQVVSGVKALGIFSVVEAAWGADMVAYQEASELVEKGFLTSSCCPAFVSYVQKFFPDMARHVSHNPSPMAKIAYYLKRMDPACKVVFIGPCIAKKGEIRREDVQGLVDCVITFEELLALFNSRDIEPSTLADDMLDNASYFGRIFARSGGLSDAVAQALKEHQIGEGDFALKPQVCSGIDECKAALLRASKNVLPANFIEGMACEQGCIGGPACLTHGPKDKAEVDKYGRLAMEKSIKDAIGVLEYIK